MSRLAVDYQSNGKNGLPDDSSDAGGIAREAPTHRIAQRGDLVCSDNIPYMAHLPDGVFKLIVTSPPYNLGKPYDYKSGLDDYLSMQERVIWVGYRSYKGSLEISEKETFQET